MKKKFAIIGAGITGATIARLLYDKGYEIDLYEEENNVGGNCYDYISDNIVIHGSGPHIFHTSNEKIVKFIKRFSKWNNFINSPLANYKGNLYSLPFNMMTYYQLWGTKTPEEAKKKIKLQTTFECSGDMSLKDHVISMVGIEIFEKLVKGYTEKQWGQSCENLPADIIKRLPLRFTYNNNYFNDNYQMIPQKGYTDFITKLCPCYMTGTFIDFYKIKELQSKGYIIIFTGEIDNLFEYRFGKLDYRKLTFETEKLEITSFQGNAVVNYTSTDEPWTRITEHKHFDYSKSELPYTYISKEFSSSDKGISAYPVESKENLEKYNKYHNMAIENHIILAGRMAEFKYKNMDKCIEDSMTLVHELTGE